MITISDKIDENILNALVGNSRLSCREIAKKTGVSAVTVLKRLKRLEKDKVIIGYSANLDYEKLGFDIDVIIKARIAKGKLLEVEKKIASHPGVTAVYDVTGQFDAIIIAKFRTRKQMDQFLKKIQTYEFVERTETSLILNTVVEKKAGLGSS